VEFALQALHLLDGQTVSIPDGGITLVTGPNNAGKSVLLREINSALTFPQQLTQPGTEGLWVSNIDLSIDQDPLKIEDWFNSVSRIIPNGPWPLAGRRGLFDEQNYHNSIDLAIARSLIVGKNGLRQLAPWLVTYHDALGRGGLLTSAPARDAMAPASNPLHRLWDSRPSERHLSDLLQRAFGFEVCVNRYAQRVELLMGRPTRPDEVLPASPELLDEYARLPGLITQGDGVRSFAGLMLWAIAGSARIVLIDEPEAFLHPPQARLIGRYLADETPKGTQIIVATHSAEVLEGALDGSREVRVIRLQAEPEGDRVSRTLNPRRVRSLWTDPLFRYSDMLDGLFHRGTVICESDGDCRLYSAVLDGRLARAAAQDLNFTHVGGKDRLPIALKELSELGLRVAILGDLDIVNDTSRVTLLAEAIGLPYAEIAEDLRIVHDAVGSRSSAPVVRNLKDAARPVLARADRSPVLEAEARAIRDSVKFRSGWDELKRSGTRGLDGPSFNAMSNLLTTLARRGIFLAPVGDLERWFPELNVGHGRAFVTEVLERRLHLSPPTELATFIDAVASFFGFTTPTDPAGNYAEPT